MINIHKSTYFFSFYSQMSAMKKFRLISNYEKSIIINSILEVSPNINSIFEERQYSFYSLFDSQKGTYTIYIVNSNQFYIKNFKELYPKIREIGLYFGYINKEIFYLSLEGAEYLYKNHYFIEEKFIQVNKNGEKSVLYGNDILKEMVKELSPILHKKDILVIINELDEVLAIGYSNIKSNQISQLKPKDVVAMNLRDKGYYLRVKQ